MARFDEALIRKIKEETDIVALIESYGTKLKGSGDELMGLCPVHNDTNPSLGVNRRKKLWNCLGACGKGGDVISWVQHADKVSYGHAVELLKEKAVGVMSSGGTKAQNVHRLESPINPEADDHQLLAQVADYYHSRLQQAPDAMDYLKKRGIDDPEAIKKFKIGFCDRTLGLRLPTRDSKAGKAIRGRLQDLGVMKKTGHERMRGAVTFPFATPGGVGEIFGRRIDPKTEQKYRRWYLDGPHVGVWNAEAFQAYDEIILCESVIDALTFWCAGFHNVSTIHGTNGLTQEILDTLKQHNVQRLILAYDNDAAGDEAVERHQPQFENLGIELFRANFVKGSDANDCFPKSRSPAVIEGYHPAYPDLSSAIRFAEWLGQGKTPAIQTPTTDFLTPARQQAIETLAKEKAAEEQAAQEKAAKLQAAQAAQAQREAELAATAGERAKQWHNDIKAIHQKAKQAKQQAKSKSKPQPTSQGAQDAKNELPNHALSDLQGETSTEKTTKQMAAERLSEIQNLQKERAAKEKEPTDIGKATPKKAPEPRTKTTIDGSLSGAEAMNAAGSQASRSKASVSDPVVSQVSKVAAGPTHQEPSSRTEPAASALHLPHGGASQPVTPVASPVPQPRPPEKEIQIEVKDQEIVFPCGNRTYRVRGLENNTSYEVLKINILSRRETQFHVDTFDLYQSRPRTSFIKQASIELSLDETVIKRDLGRILMKLEQLQEDQIKGILKPVEEPVVEMTQEEETAALEFWKAPNLCGRILKHFAIRGIVGEEVNKLVAYLCVISRKLCDPLAVLIQSSSAAGKSSLMDAVLAFVPDEDKVIYSAMTGQSLYYMGGGNLKHKILAISEEEGVQQASYALKLLQSEGSLRIASTGKDPNTGRMETQEYTVEGPVMLFLTTTRFDIDKELENRCITLEVNESRRQTAAIHDQQRLSQTRQGLANRKRRDAIVQLHQNAQRLLKPIEVVNNFADQLTFRTDLTRSRRDNAKYLALIRTVTLLHQYQREIKTETIDGVEVQFIETTVEDIRMANRLAREVLDGAFREIPEKTEQLLMSIVEMAQQASQELEIPVEDYRFTRRQIRRWLLDHNQTISPTHFKRHLVILEDFEYLVLHSGGGRGRLKMYGLNYDPEEDGPLSDVQIGLIDPETLTAAPAPAPESPSTTNTPSTQKSTSPEEVPGSPSLEVDFFQGQNPNENDNSSVQKERSPSNSGNA